MPKPTPAAAILPYQVKLGGRPAQISLDALDWPLGRPDRLRGTGRTVADLAPFDHLLIFPRTSVHLRPSFGTRAQVSIMMFEPEAIHGKHMRLLRYSHRRFHRVLTSNEALLAAIPNGLLFPLGSTWVPDWAERRHVKTRMCSLIASGKRDLEGHKLRHSMADWVMNDGLDVDVMGKGYQPFEHKHEGLSPYRFSIVIENVRERNYFSEKLVDAVLCQTVPIYWGCPNLGDFMETSGMILCETGDEMRNAVRNLTEDRYADLLPGLLKGIEGASDYAPLYERAARAVLAG
jgi:hypothetical protein